MKLSERGIVIRRMSEDDLRQIYYEAENEPLFKKMAFPFTAENLAEIFASDNSICLTALRKKKVFGFIIGSVNVYESLIRWIMVKEKFRNTGIGKELMKEYFQAAENSSVQKYLIAQYRTNNETIKFFSGFGFSPEETFIELSLESDQTF